MLNYRFILVFIVLAGWHSVHAQLLTERQAYSNLQKGKWDKAWVQVTKIVRKDSTNIVAWYVCATYFFDPANPAFQIDSAYKYTMTALARLPDAGAKQRDKMRRFPLDSAGLVTTRQAIDSAAFERAKTINTEQAYLGFIAGFPFARQLDRARELRDEVAYIDALKENTYTSFLKYLQRYPNASRAPEARERYEKLLFEAKTKDRKLLSYRTFIKEYPASPYRHEAEQQVFEISTASGNANDFLAFMKDYPDSKFYNRARNIFYHIVRETNQLVPSVIVNDSLNTLISFEQEYLVPFYREGKFGFMDAHGKEVIKPIAKEIGREYQCGNILEELLVLDELVVARNGAIVFRGDVEELDDIGYGFLFIVGTDCGAVVHKSGLVIELCADDVRVIGGAFLAIRKEKRWRLKTFTGRELPVGSFDDADAIDDVLVLKQSGKTLLKRKEEVAASADQLMVAFNTKYDEAKRWGEEMIWVRVGNKQGLLDMNLHERIKLTTQEIQPAFFGAVSKTAEGYRLWTKSGGESESFKQIKIQQPWVAVQQNNQWRIANRFVNTFNKETFDSIYFTGPFCMAVKGDTTHAYSTDVHSVLLTGNARIQFLPGKDSVYFILLEEGDKKQLYNSGGERLFTVQYDRIDFAGENLFTVMRKGKRGLINLQGRPVVPTDYDAIGNIDQGTVPVLKDKKFGILDIVNRKEIKPQYEKNIVRFNHQYLIAFKAGYSGLIDWNNKSITPFEYEEIRYWNDSCALVRKDYQWLVYNFVEKKIVADKIRKFTWLRETTTDKLAIVQQEHSYGVLSSKNGFILQPTFSDIVNLGSATKPLYFTEKHVEEASIYVVIYYDENGTLLRRQVFETDDYERIYCSQN
ncbi:MAG: WG repeat-containing protein [Cyclobacteriaceae bacterium]|nr:WG repeat-containing protein [Cyclobacteriaceae bacterium]